MKNLNTKAGISILGLIVLALIAILVLSYFNVSIKSVVESPTGQENVTYVRGGLQGIWYTYLEAPVSYFWNEVWIKIFWQGFLNNMKRIRDGQPTEFQDAAKNLQINR